MSIDLPDELLTRLEPLRKVLERARNSVLPVVGSGLSRPSLKSWVDLIADLAKELNLEDREEVESVLHRSQFLDAASYLEQKIPSGRNRIATVIKDLYARPRAPRPLVYDLVVSLPSDLTTDVRYRFSPEDRDLNHGFRCARENVQLRS
jgi:hypothetical protein